ncbi:MAG: hypothetical protein AAGI17_10690 [Planctomycetota bacterium]
MKLIWAIVALLFGSTGVVFFADSGADNAGGTAAITQTTSSTAAVTTPRPRTPTPALEITPDPMAEPVATEPEITITDVTMEQTNPVEMTEDMQVVDGSDLPNMSIFEATAPTAENVQAEAEQPAAEGTIPSQVADALADPDAAIGSYLGKSQAAPKTEAEVVTDVDAEPSPEEIAAAAPEQGEAEVIEAWAETEADVAAEAIAETEKKVAGAFVLNDDGSLQIGEKWTITGAGTKESPYLVPWDLLVSASSSYEPRLGLEEIPAWAKHMDGKVVTLAGYLLLPMGGGAAQDILAMRNQWDGCCIGTPPTPYDAVEVRLSESIDTFSTPGLTSYGSVTGTFKTDPYVVNGWLLGMYLMDNAYIGDARDVDVP